MFNNYIISITIIAHVLGISLPQAIEEDVYLVPTTIDPIVQEVQEEDGFVEVIRDFEWQVMRNLQTQIIPPKKVGDDRAPEINAKAGMIMDVDTQRVLWQKNPDYMLSIASITKLMTALTWLDHQPQDGLNHVHTFTSDQDTVEGKELNLPYGEKLTAFDLLRSSIVGSDNDTAIALAHTTEKSDEEFIALMNEKAKDIGIQHAVFVDQSGLDAGNMATPYDVAILAREAFRQEEIQVPASMKEHEQRTVETNTFTSVRTTNRLLYDPSLKIIGGKTGHTTVAGYCFVVQIREPESGRDIIVVLLGSDSEQARFDEAKQLVAWAFDQYVWN